MATDNGPLPRRSLRTGSWRSACSSRSLFASWPGLSSQNSWTSETFSVFLVIRKVMAENAVSIVERLFITPSETWTRVPQDVFWAAVVRHCQLPELFQRPNLASSTMLLNCVLGKNVSASASVVG